MALDHSPFWTFHPRPCQLIRRFCAQNCQLLGLSALSHYPGTGNTLLYTKDTGIPPPCSAEQHLSSTSSHTPFCANHVLVHHFRPKNKDKILTAERQTSGRFRSFVYGDTHRQKLGKLAVEGYLVRPPYPRPTLYYVSCLLSHPKKKKKKVPAGTHLSTSSSASVFVLFLFLFLAGHGV